VERKPSSILWIISHPEKEARININDKLFLNALECLIFLTGGNPYKWKGLTRKIIATDTCRDLIKFYKFRVLENESTMKTL
jgi:hypothetical protein